MRPSARTLLTGALGGLLLGWLLPMLLGPPIAAWGPSFRDDPRLSDAIVGAGGLLVYIAEAPAMYIAEHLTTTLRAATVINAFGWTLIGLTTGALVVAIRRRSALLIGARAGLLFGWMLPAIAGTLGECFVHCWMHEGLLGTMALVGGAMLRAVGVLAELPWRLLAGAPETVPSLLAIPVSAGVWVAVGTGLAVGAAALRRSFGAAPQEAGGDGASGGEPHSADPPHLQAGDRDWPCCGNVAADCAAQRGRPSCGSMPPNE